jgi:hypothetical protein
MIVEELAVESWAAFTKKRANAVVASEEMHGGCQIHARAYTDRDDI